MPVFAAKRFVWRGGKVVCCMYDLSISNESVLNIKIAALLPCSYP